MASHGSNRHQKRLAAPKVAGIKRKSHVYLAKPRPGKHQKSQAISASTLLVDIMGLCENRRQADVLLSSGHVVIDGRRTFAKAPVGLMDVVSIPSVKKHFVLVLRAGVLRPQAIDEKNAQAKNYRLVHKTVLSLDKIQLGLHDGRTLLVTKKQDVHSLGDTLRLSIQGQKIESSFKLEKGATAYVFKGRHAGYVGTVDDIQPATANRRSEVRLSGATGSLITLKDYLFIVEPGFTVTV
jgi:small subunit ribosomal protein S4e